MRPLIESLRELVLPARALILPWRDDTVEEALVERVVRLGRGVRLRLLLADGRMGWARLSSDEAELLEILPGQILYVDLGRRTGAPPPARIGERQVGARSLLLCGALLALWLAIGGPLGARGKHPDALAGEGLFGPGGPHATAGAERRIRP
jgi:hypothetical protein